MAAPASSTRSSEGFVVALVGATGAVGQEMRRLLEERHFPVREFRPFASPRSVGTELLLNGRAWPVRALSEGCFAGVQLALFSAGAAVSRAWGPQAVAAGALVADNSSAWRMDPGTALVVPEVNPQALPEAPALVAVPNCSTIQLVVALQPLHARFGLTRVIVSTYQSASGAGARAMAELDSTTRGYLEGTEAAPSRFVHPIAFNLIPQIAEFGADAYTEEELKMMNETRKIMNLPELPVVATCVRVPVQRGHSESVWARFERPIDLDEARRALAAFPGVIVQDDPAARLYPMPRNAAGRNAVYVGRLRRDPSDPHALVFWVVADNLLKGAALNAVQIAEAVLLKPAAARP